MIGLAYSVWHISRSSESDTVAKRRPVRAYACYLYVMYYALSRWGERHLQPQTRFMSNAFWLFRAHGTCLVAANVVLFLIENEI